MQHATQNFVRPGHEVRIDPDFPHAPMDWTRESADALAREEGLTLTGDHWRVIHALQEFYARHEEPAMNAREIHDALDEAFHADGGLKYLYRLFPKGPLAQGCPLAGLPAPGGSRDQGFGSAV